MTESVKKELLDQGIFSIWASLDNMSTYSTAVDVEHCYGRLCGKISMLCDLDLIDFDTYFKLCNESAALYFETMRQIKEVV